MDLKLLRFVAAFGVGFALLVAASATVSARHAGEDITNSGRVANRHRTVQPLVLAVDILARRDSLLANWSRMPNRPAIQTVLQADYARETPRDPPRGSVAVSKFLARQERIETFLGSYALSRFGATPRVPVVLMLNRPSAIHHHEFTVSRRTFAMLPEATDGRTCFVSVYANPNRLLTVAAWDSAGGRASRRSTSLERILDDATGVCYFLARHGLPGRAISPWLRTTGYWPASSARELKTAERASILDSPVVESAPGKFELEETPLSTACAAGRLPMCDAIWQSLGSSPTRLAVLPSGVVFPRVYASQAYHGSSQFLAAVEDRVGADRFGKLWQSAGSLDSAFVAATGDTRLEAVSKFTAKRIQSRSTSPWPSLWEWIVWLALMGGALGAGFVLSGRREMAR